MGLGDEWILTVPRPPFNGSYCWAVDHKLLGGCIVGGFSLQALKIGPVPQFCLGICSKDLELGAERVPLGNLFLRSQAPEGFLEDFVYT